jgi:hypothetical protein
VANRVVSHLASRLENRAVVPRRSPHLDRHGCPR